MALTIRSADGELQVAGLAELERAARAGVVDGEDEVQLEAGQPWRKVREVVAPRRWRDRVSPWYVIAAILAVELVAGAGLVVVSVTFTCFLLWHQWVRPRKDRRRMRWW